VRSQVLADTPLRSQLQYLLAAHISNNVPPGAKVVEFGCGTGAPPCTAFLPELS